VSVPRASSQLGAPPAGGLKIPSQHPLPNGRSHHPILPLHRQTREGLYDNHQHLGQSLPFAVAICSLHGACISGHSRYTELGFKASNLAEGLRCQLVRF